VANLNTLTHKAVVPILAFVWKFTGFVVFVAVVAGITIKDLAISSRTPMKAFRI
jgi:hypothetical protein